MYIVDMEGGAQATAPDASVIDFDTGGGGEGDPPPAGGTSAPLRRRRGRRYVGSRVS